MPGLGIFKNTFLVLQCHNETWSPRTVSVASIWAVPSLIIPRAHWLKLSNSALELLIKKTSSLIQVPYGSSSPASVKEAQWGLELSTSGSASRDLNHWALSSQQDLSSLREQPLSKTSRSVTTGVTFLSVSPSDPSHFCWTTTVVENNIPALLKNTYWRLLRSTQRRLHNNLLKINIGDHR